MDATPRPDIKQPRPKNPRVADQAQRAVRLHKAPASGTQGLALAKVVAPGSQRVDEPRAGAGGVRPQLRMAVPAELASGGQPVNEGIVSVTHIPVEPMAGLSESPTPEAILGFIQQLKPDRHTSTLVAVCGGILARIDEAFQRAPTASSGCV